MNRPYLCVEAVILLLLTQLGYDDWNRLHSHCSRDRARVVRNIIYKRLIPIFDRYRISIPLECPFNPKRDYLWWPNTGEIDSNDFYDGFGKTWFCPFCGKSFLCAERLTIHWDEEHRQYLNSTEDSVCLADYCDIMRCDVLISVQKKRNSRSDLQYSFSEESDELKECNETKMAKLESKCRTIVRQCIVGLLASSLSMKDFREIEDDLLKAICSYLRCDKFWDDSMNESRSIPITLCIFIGVFLIAGFCVCYYIVWTLFENNSTPKLELIKRKPDFETIADAEKMMPLISSMKNGKRSREAEDVLKEMNAGIQRPQYLSLQQPYRQSRPKILVTTAGLRHSPLSRSMSSQSSHYYHRQSTQYQFRQITSVGEEEKAESCGGDVPLAIYTRNTPSGTTGTPLTSNTPTPSSGRQRAQLNTASSKTQSPFNSQTPKLPSSHSTLYR